MLTSPPKDACDPDACSLCTLQSVLTPQGRIRPSQGRKHPFVKASLWTCTVGLQVKDVRDVMDKARKDLTASGRRTIVFVDEIHRWDPPF